MVDAKFPHQYRTDLRYGDTDRQGHINNAVFATLFESGRVDFLVNEETNLPPGGCDFVIAEITIKYLSELHFPNKVNVKSAIIRIGNSSFGLAQEIEANGKIVASAASAIVMMDRDTRKSAPFDDVTRSKLESYMPK